MEDTVTLVENNENNLIGLFPITSVEAFQNIQTKLLLYF